MGEHREPWQYAPEASRRARGVEIWAALRSLGRSGLAEMIERNCRLASRFADGFRRAGFAVLNEVVLNQVIVSFGDAEKTRRVIAEVQSEGTCWCGGTEWQRTSRDAHQRVILGDDRRRRRSQPGCNLANREMSGT